MANLWGGRFTEATDSSAYRFNQSIFFDKRMYAEDIEGSIAHATLECPLAAASGRWYGKRTGRYVDSRDRLRGGSARFPMKGNYRFEVGNGMRDSAISGLKDISLRIEYRTTK